jgi:hypothetical protein
LLFRISTLNRNFQQGFDTQDAFIRDIVRALTPAARKQLVGLS